VHVISSAPPLKGAGVDGAPVSEPQVAEWRRQVESAAAWFVAEVARGRRMSAERVEKLATGQVWIAGDAQALGLVDAVAPFDVALEELQREADAALVARARRDRRPAVPVSDAVRATVAAQVRAKLGASRGTPAPAPIAPRGRSSADIREELRRVAAEGGPEAYEKACRLLREHEERRVAEGGAWPA